MTSEQPDEPALAEDESKATPVDRMVDLAVMRRDRKRNNFV